jgi:hypothetical protein
MNIEALVAEQALVSVNETDTGFGGYNALESRLCYWHILTSVLKSNALNPSTNGVARGVKFHFTEFGAASGSTDGYSRRLTVTKCSLRNGGSDPEI